MVALLWGSLAVLGAVGLGLVGLVLLLAPPSLPVPPQRDWVFRRVTLLEPGLPPRPGATVRVRAGVLELSVPGTDADRALRNASGDVEAPDLAGLHVVPGLVDMHVHYPPRLAVGNAELWSLLLLAHGVTAIRETGSIDGSIFAVREAIRAGSTPGPRIFACGRMLDGPQPSFPSNLVVRTPAEARAAVLEQARAGADCIKVYNMLGREVLAAIVETARSLDLPVIGHKPHSVATGEAGIVDLQHGTGVVPVDVRRVGRQDFRLEDWAALDDAHLSEAIELSREHGIAHTPTLVNSTMRQWLLADQPRPAIWAIDTGLRHMPAFWNQIWHLIWTAPHRPGDAEGAAVVEHFRRRQREMTAALHDAGIPVHAGTDTLMPYVAPGSSLHGELRELHAAGIASEEVWRIATRDAGRALGAPDLGRIVSGAPADLLFLARDPREDLTALAEIRAVLADGRLYRRADLDAALARYDAHFLADFYGRVMGFAARWLQHLFAPER